MMKLNLLLVAFSALLAGISPAFSAETTDYSDESYDWAGFYLGVYGAYGEGTSKSDVAVDAHPSDPFPGIHAGYLFNLDSVILGVEGDASLADLDDDIVSGGLVTQDFDNIASVRARVGLPIDNTLLFANAGWAWADTEYGYLVEKDQKVISGPTVGVGAQYAFSNSFIGRIEYNHYFYGSTTYDLETQVDVKNSLDEIRAGVDFIFH
ncbi:MAG TPA: outer membrane beta-barrel protein [Aestuariivirga sp.]|nr:outer membrane beta-barrel protein [Aestuariivirga sp.]